MITKSNGVRQPFDRAKIVTGVAAAGKGRPITAEQIEHLAEEVEHKRVAFDVYQASGGGRLRYAWAMTIAALVLSLGSLLGTITMLRAEGRLFSPVAWFRLAGWSLSFIFVALPVMVISALPGHHPDQLVDPAGLEHWLDHLDPETSTVPEWALP